ncbi:pilus assembly FimT family protein, partial [Vibrio crassostreae]
MMHRRNKQRGFIIISMMVVFGFLSLVGIQWANMQEKRNVQANANSFYHHVLHLRQQIHAYTARQFQKGIAIDQSALFPSRLDSLVPEFYAPCQAADNAAGRCKPYDQTPWGKINNSDYRIVGVGGTPSNPDFYRAELDIKLPPASDDAYKYERAATLSLFSKIPSIVFDEPNNLITLRIDRPDKAFAYDGLVKRSGDDST